MEKSIVMWKAFQNIYLEIFLVLFNILSNKIDLTLHRVHNFPFISGPRNHKNVHYVDKKKEM